MGRWGDLFPVFVWILFNFYNFAKPQSDVRMCCRFYFVGDEDLLEIIGNSKNLPRLQKHLKKMFAGVTSILLDDDNNQVLGIGSKEGEEVRYY